MEPKMGKQLEMTFRYLEDVPNYEEKLKIWEFLQLSEKQQQAKREALLPNGHKNASPVRAAINLNNGAGVPLLEGNPRTGTINFVPNEQLYDMCKDILDKFGNPLASREQKKAA